MPKVATRTLAAAVSVWPRPTKQLVVVAGRGWWQRRRWRRGCGGGGGGGGGGGDGSGGGGEGLVAVGVAAAAAEAVGMAGLRLEQWICSAGVAF